jgi:hypothetical protein
MIHDNRARIFGDSKDTLFVRLGSQHVQIGNQEETFVLILEGEAMAMAANKVAQMELACGPVAGENSFAGWCVTHNRFLNFLELISKLYF